MSFCSMNAEFTDNAFLFLVNRKRIIRDERLYYVKVELPDELTYIGGFSPITLGSMSAGGMSARGRYILIIMTLCRWCGLSRAVSDCTMTAAWRWIRRDRQ